MEDLPIPSLSPWDFSLISNVSPSPPSLTVSYPTSPSLEWQRARYMEEIQCRLRQLCAKRFHIKPPLGSFTQWFLEMKVHDRGDDPLLPSECTNFVSEAFVNDLLSVIPPLFSHTTEANVARAEFTQFTAWLTNLVRQNKCDSQLRKNCLRQTREYLSWLRDNRSADVNAILGSHHQLRCEARPVLDSILRPQVQEISSLLSDMSRSLATQRKNCLRQTREYLSWLRDNRSADVNAILGSHHQLRCEARPVLDSILRPQVQEISSLLSDMSRSLATQLKDAKFVAEQQSSIQVVKVSAGGSVELLYRGDRCSLSALHYTKLCELHKTTCGDVPSEVLHERIWCLLRRYQSFLFCDGESVDGLQNQAALPVSVFQCLAQHFGVTFEMFASPLNCYFAQFCSAFLDTDIYFGSRGPVLSFSPTRGSFEVNPPFNETLLERLAHHIEHLLEASEEALSFVIILPDFRERPYKALELLNTSQYKRCDVSLRDQEHSYRITSFPFDKCGGEAAEVTQISCNATLLLFLQNDAGHATWTPTPNRINALIAAYDTAPV